MTAQLRFGTCSTHICGLLAYSADVRYRTLSLRARWTIFTAPLTQVIHITGDTIGRLRGCTLCISQDGTIAVIALDGYQLCVFFSKWFIIRAKIPQHIPRAYFLSSVDADTHRRRQPASLVSGWPR